MNPIDNTHLEWLAVVVEGNHPHAELLPTPGYLIRLNDKVEGPSCIQLNRVKTHTIRY